jgi:WD40 repeat protein
LLDDRRLLLASDAACELEVWDMSADRCLARYSGHTYAVNGFAVTPDGRYALSGGSDDSVRLWSLGDEHGPADRPYRHARLIYGCSMDAYAAFVCSAPQNEAPAVWDARRGGRLTVLPTDLEYGNVRFCQFQGEQRIAVLGQRLRVFDNTAACLWEAEVPVRDQYGRASFLGATDTSATDRWLPLIDAGDHVIVWAEETGLSPVPIGPGDKMLSRFCGGSKLAVLSGDELRIVDLKRPGAPRLIAEGIRSCIGSPTRGQVYAATTDNRLHRLDAETGELLQTLGELPQVRVRLLVDPQESVLWAIGPEEEPTVLIPYSGPESLMAVLLEGSGAMRRADISGHKLVDTCFLSGKLITAGWDATIRIWDPHAAMPCATVMGSAPFRCVDAAEDRIAAGDQRGNVWVFEPLRGLYPS